MQCKPCKPCQVFGAQNPTGHKIQPLSTGSVAFVPGPANFHCRRGSPSFVQWELFALRSLSECDGHLFRFSTGSKLYTRQIHHQHGTARHLQVARQTLWDTDENQAKCIHSCPMTWHWKQTAVEYDQPRSMTQMCCILKFRRPNLNPFSHKFA